MIGLLFKYIKNEGTNSLHACITVVPKDSIQNTTCLITFVSKKGL